MTDLKVINDEIFIIEKEVIKIGRKKFTLMSYIIGLKGKNLHDEDQCKKFLKTIYKEVIFINGFYNDTYETFKVYFLCK